MDKKRPLKKSLRIQDTKDSELMAVFQYLQIAPATATMVAAALNIYRPNLSWRKDRLQKAGLLVEVVKYPCKITKRPAWYLSTNPALILILSRRKPFMYGRK